MSPETLQALNELGLLDDPKYKLLADAFEKHSKKIEEKVAVPTVSFKDKKLKSVKENSTTLLVFFVNGKYVKLGGTDYKIELTCDSKSVSFSTTSWGDIEEGFTIKTNITTKTPEVINIGFKFDGKDSNSLNLVVAGTQVEKPEKCLCKKEIWSANDLRYIVTELRKKDRKMLQKDYDEKGNPYFLDKKGNKVRSNDRGKAPNEGDSFYYKETSFYDRNDDVDKKPLKDRIFFYDSNKADDDENYNLDSNYANYETFSKYLNQVFKDYKIKKCIQRIHFLAQIYVETNRFRTTYEDKPDNDYSGGEFYRGRGMKQITHDYNYLEYYDIRKGKDKKLNELYRKNRNENFDPKKGPKYVESVVAFKNRTNNEFISDDQMNEFNEFVKLLSTSIYWACDSAGWYWNKQELNTHATDDENAIVVVSAKVNNPGASTKSNANGINQFTERKMYYEYLKEIFDYENCK